MKKLLSVMFCMGLVGMLSVSVGCGDKKDKKTATTPTKTTPTATTTPPTTTPPTTTPPTTTPPTTTPPTTTPPTTIPPKTPVTTPPTTSPPTTTPPTTPPVDKKEVALTPAKGATLKVKQGDKADVNFKLGYKGGAKDAKVTVKGEAPKGLKVSFEAKNGDVKVTVAAAEDAKEGDHTVTIEAAADGAATASATLTITVEKKK